MPHQIRVNRLIYMLAREDTTLLRFYFGLASLFMSIRLWTDDNWMYFHETSLKIAQPETFSLMFLIHSCAVIYGSITSRYGISLLWLEGILGVFIWTSIAWADVIDIGTVSPSMMAAVVAFFLLVRYPTHYGRRGEGINVG